MHQELLLMGRAKLQFIPRYDNAGKVLCSVDLYLDTNWNLGSLRRSNAGFWRAFFIGGSLVDDINLEAIAKELRRLNSLDNGTIRRIHE